MIGLITGGLQVAGGIAGFMDAKKEAKWGKRNAAEAKAQADARLQQMDEILKGVGGDRQQMQRLSGEQRAMSEEMDRFSAGNQRIVDEQRRIRQGAMGLADETAGIRGDVRAMRTADQDRYGRLGFDDIEGDLAAQVRDGVDVEGRANTAAGEFTNQFDVSMDAQRRAMRRAGVGAGDSAMARLGEDAAYQRARGAATAANTARREADDLNFARRVAFADRGAGLRSTIRGQMGQEAGMVGAELGQRGANFNMAGSEFANRNVRYGQMGDRFNRRGVEFNQTQAITNSRMGEFGAQGQIRGEYLGERNQQQARSTAAREAMVNSGAMLGKGLFGITQGAGMPGMDQYVRPTGA